MTLEPERPAIQFFDHAVQPSNPYEGTVHRLLQAIHLGFVTFGERLPSERELALRFCVSRATVREAITTLTEAGYLESKRGRYGGTFVVSTRPRADGGAAAGSRITESELDDLHALRTVIELGVVRLLAERPLDPDARARLQDSLCSSEAAPSEEFRRFDSRFHLTLAELTGSDSLVQLAIDLRTRVNSALDEIPLLSPNLAHANRQHRFIVDAVLANRADRALTEMEHHIEGTHALLVGFLSR